MSAEYKIVKSDAITAKIARKAPSTLIMESLPPGYMNMRMMADHVGVHIETMRRLCRTDKVHAPSEAAQAGDMVMYLFNEEDIKEIEKYFTEKGYTIRAT